MACCGPHGRFQFGHPPAARLSLLLGHAGRPPRGEVGIGGVCAGPGGPGSCRPSVRVVADRAGVVEHPISAVAIGSRGITHCLRNPGLRLGIPPCSSGSEGGDPIAAPAQSGSVSILRSSTTTANHYGSMQAPAAIFRSSKTVALGADFSRARRFRFEAPAGGSVGTGPLIGQAPKPRLRNRFIVTSATAPWRRAWSGCCPLEGRVQRPQPRILSLAKRWSPCWPTPLRHRPL